MDIVVTATRTDGWWALSVPSIKGLNTQVRRLDQIEDMVRDALSLFPEVIANPDDATITVEVTGLAAQQARAARSLNERAKRMQDEAAQALQQSAGELAAEGYPVRDIGTLLGVSFQRAHQLPHK